MWSFNILHLLKFDVRGGQNRQTQIKCNTLLSLDMQKYTKVQVVESQEFIEGTTYTKGNSFCNKNKEILLYGSSWKIVCPKN